jgi:uncharacterized membrane protein
MRFGNTKVLAMLVMFVSLSVIGSMIKIPTTLGSIALDSAPAVIAGALLGPLHGAIVAAIGHVSSAFFAGFPLGLFHLLIALEMGLLVYGFGLLFQKNWKKTAYLLFFIGNAFVAPLPFVFFMGTAFVVGILPFLVIGTAVNLVVSMIVIPAVLKVRMKDREEMPHA